MSGRADRHGDGAGLGAALERVAAAFDPARRLDHDPLGIVRRYSVEDRVVVAHVAAALAYGSVPLLRAAIESVLAAVGPSPRSAIARWEPGDFARLRPDFVYRMTRAEDVDALLTALGALLRRYGTLEAAFGAGGVAPEDDARPPLIRYVERLRAAMGEGARRRGARYLTPDPSTGSATKRWHLLLRWLVRPDDGADLGAWTVLRPSQLVMPLDTHTSRLARSLGLTDRRTVDYRMARQVTDALRVFDPDDPLRFDMPLCHLGIAGDCAHRYVPDICTRCDLRGVCRWTAGA